MTDVAETVAIQQLYALYGHLMDDRAWERLTEVFTPDCVFDASALGVPLMTGVESIAEIAGSSPQQPLAHHVTTSWSTASTATRRASAQRPSGSTPRAARSAASTTTP